MLLNVEPSPVDSSAFLDQARLAADRAASAARITIRDEVDVDRMRVISELLVTVWGTSPQEAPIPYDLLRSIGHAGCNVTAAYAADGRLCGAAVAIVSPLAATAYSLIAGVLPGVADRGVGFALKQHQRAWALERGLTTMVWTFDPLVSRNARFNLTKLGAEASEYIPAFYGVMDDGINGNDDTDRLVAVWALTTPRTLACSLGEPEPVDLPRSTPGDIRGVGPDGSAALIEIDGALWCRVPHDIVALRSEAPAEATAWRSSTRTMLTEALASGYRADGLTRSGWYRLSRGDHE